MDYKPMATSMVVNIKSFVDSVSNLIDPFAYKQWIGSLKYMVNTKPNICFVVKTLSYYMVEPRQIQWVIKHVL
jgi:hypothetical protein